MINKLLLNISKSNLTVGLGVLSLVELSFMVENFRIEFYSYFAFFSTVSVYSYAIASTFIKSFEASELLKFRLHIVSLLISAGPILFFFFQFRYNLQLMILSVAIVSFFYPLVLKNRYGFSLRMLPYTKVILISFSWAAVCYLFPVLAHFNHLSSSHLAMFAALVSLIVAMVIPFDIRDSRTDPKSMKTIPQVLGLKFSKHLASFLFVVAMVYFSIVFVSSTRQLIVNTILIVFFSFLVYNSDRRQKPYYFSVYIESIPVFLYLNYIL